ncbi:hypothetical protein PMIN04_012946 [Paraphaeosphaeria minitans]
MSTYHLHVASPVNTPPSSGPMTEAMPNMLDRTPRCTALFLSGADNPMMVAPPEKMADAPTPATARPTMSAAELRAVAHTMEPTVFVSRYRGRTLAPILAYSGKWPWR